MFRKRVTEALPEPIQQQLIVSHQDCMAYALRLIRRAKRPFSKEQAIILHLALTLEREQELRSLYQGACEKAINTLNVHNK